MPGSGDLIAQRTVVNNLISRVESIEKQLNTLRLAVNDNLAVKQLLAGISDEFTVTNGNTDYSYDADASSTAELADIVYTILYELANL